MHGLGGNGSQDVRARPRRVGNRRRQVAARLHIQLPRTSGLGRHNVDARARLPDLVIVQELPVVSVVRAQSVSVGVRHGQVHRGVGADHPVSLRRNVVDVLVYFLVRGLVDRPVVVEGSGNHVADVVFGHPRKFCVLGAKVDHPGAAVGRLVEGSGVRALWVAGVVAKAAAPHRLQCLLQLGGEVLALLVHGTIVLGPLLAPSVVGVLTRGLETSRLLYQPEVEGVRLCGLEHAGEMRDHDLLLLADALSFAGPPEARRHPHGIDAIKLLVELDDFAVEYIVDDVLVEHVVTAADRDHLEHCLEGVQAGLEDHHATVVLGFAGPLVRLAPVGGHSDVPIGDDRGVQQ
mmetsp:Transcript_48312/g.125281  ORF Transcript_48312/g.125281 Transcript_48312/m.125281 type:complete len:347 (-) Transcript_48312:39-1079(-)